MFNNTFTISYQEIRYHLIQSDSKKKKKVHHYSLIICNKEIQEVLTGFERACKNKANNQSMSGVCESILQPRACRCVYQNVFE